jgi:hypothetical protein
MINFYKFYNKNGLDKEEYALLIEQMFRENYTNELKPIEHLIKKKSYHAYFYALKVLKCRWFEAEPYILKANNPGHAFFYASHIIKGRWVEAEPFIMKSSYYAYYYACDVIDGRWAEAEMFIKEDADWWRLYRLEFNIC